jgi:DHA2 family multidrug resistance protein
MPMTQTLLLRIFPPDKGGGARPVGDDHGGRADCRADLRRIISDNWSWHWLFFINIPIAAFCLVSAWRMILPYETPTQKRPSISSGWRCWWCGSGRCRSCSTRGARKTGFPVRSSSSWRVAVDRLHRLPDLGADREAPDGRPFGVPQPGFTVAVVTQSVAYAAFFTFIVLIPMFLQTNLNYTATWAGFAMCFTGVLAVVFSPIVAPAGRQGRHAPADLVRDILAGLRGALRTVWVTDMGFGPSPFRN